MTCQLIGDWKGDTVIGKDQRGALVNLVERQSKYTVLYGVPQKTAAAVRTAVARRLRPHKARVKTTTYDHGRECSNHVGMAQDLEARIDFAHPYASWERGVNENTTELIRQFFPKDRDLTQGTEQELAAVMATLNH
jgi:IS30 family transposase